MIIVLIDVEIQILKMFWGKKNLITKFKFKCIKGCGSEIAYDDIINHYNNGCKKGERRVKFLDTNEVKKIRENNGKIQYLSSKI